MRSWCAEEFVSVVDCRETLIPRPSSSNCSSHPKEQGLALPYELSHGESGLRAAWGAGLGAGVQIRKSPQDYLWQLYTGGMVVAHYTDTLKFIVLLFSLSCCLTAMTVGYCIANSFPLDHLQIGAFSRKQWPLLLYPFPDSSTRITVVMGFLIIESQ